MPLYRFRYGSTSLEQELADDAAALRHGEWLQQKGPSGQEAVQVVRIDGAQFVAVGLLPPRPGAAMTDRQRPAVIHLPPPWPEEPSGN